MILVDPRVGSGQADKGGDLLPYILALKVKAEKSQLDFGDCCFEGNGPKGRIGIGIERKRTGDMLNCIDDARYSAHQKIGMGHMDGLSILIIEGVWKPDNLTGYMMECIHALTWRPYRYRSQYVRYSKLFRYLLSVQLSGIPVIITRDIEHTAFNIVECYHYFQKKWEDHTALMETQKIALPSLTTMPTLTRRWASDIDGIGVKHSQDAEELFRTPIRLAQSDESDWLQIKGIGVASARRIMRDIWGLK